MDRPFTDPLVQRIFPTFATDVAWGLERTEKALKALGDPHRHFRSLLVGGTNGKGSVVATLESILRASGRRTGRYTSPHLCSFRERIRVDGACVSDDALEKHGAPVRDVVERFSLTFFEAVTVLAFRVFAEEGVEVAAVEVGLGGRLDATNVLSPDVTGVTNVALDHAEYLGETLPEIALEKAGIAKPGVPFVTAETAAPLLTVLGGAAAERGAPFYALDAVGEVVVGSAGTEFRTVTKNWGGLELRTPLVGAHQATNTALAIAMLDRSPSASQTTKARLLEGIRRVDHAGRSQIVTVESHTWLFDVAHNPAGVESLRGTLQRLDLSRPLVALIGIVRDKAWLEMLRGLAPVVDAMVLTQPPSVPEHRRWDPGAAADTVEAPAEALAVPRFDRALEAARKRAGDGTVLVTGSVHTVGDAMRLLDLCPGAPAFR